MRFLPLLSSHVDPASWNAFPSVELIWDGVSHPDWNSAGGGGPAVHALHLPPLRWGEPLQEKALVALRSRLAPDFLVLRSPVPQGHAAEGRFLQILELLLEVARGRSIRLALRPAVGTASQLADILRVARADAVGFCWDAGIGADLESISDRILCAVGSVDGDYDCLRTLGYRWNVALPASDPASFIQVQSRLENAYPDAFECGRNA